MRLRKRATLKTANGQPAEISRICRGKLLDTFQKLAVVLDLTAEAAERPGKFERHAELGARLAIFRARVGVGETSPRLAIELAHFGEELRHSVLEDLGFRPHEKRLEP